MRRRSLTIRLAAGPVDGLARTRLAEGRVVPAGVGAARKGPTIRPAGRITYRIQADSDRGDLAYDPGWISIVESEPNRVGWRLRVGLSGPAESKGECAAWALEIFLTTSAGYACWARTG